MNIKYIYFDQGEVLFTNDWEFDSPEKDKTFFSFYGLSREVFSNSRKKFIDLLFRGKITEKEYWKNVLVDAGATNRSPEMAIKLARKYQTYKPGMKSLIDILKKNKMPIGIISTTHKEMWNFKLKKFNVQQYFDPIITSFETGFVKPEKEIYNIALNAIGVKPAEILFIDDSQNNIAGAEALGINVILFENAENLTDKLKNLNIL